MRAVRAIVAAASGLTLLLLAAAPAAGANHPKVVIDVTTASAGDTVHVRGSGWGSDPAQVARITVCGNDGLNGSGDCDVTNTTEVGIHADGTFSGAVRISIPARPCPCVLRITSLAVAGDVRIPIELTGTLSATPSRTKTERRSVIITDARVVNRGGVLSALGLRPRRALDYRITNTGDVVLRDPAIELTWGRSAHPTGFVPAARVGTLEPGASRDATVPLPARFLDIGAFHAGVRVDPLGKVATARASALLAPWWLLLLPVPVFLAARGVRRRARQPAVDAVAPSPGTAAVAGWYEDPTDSTRLRLWDGTAWSSATRVLVETRDPVSV